MTSWVSRFRGLPVVERGRTRAGVDCCGLVCLVYGEELGIEIEPHAGWVVGDLERAELDALFRGEFDAGPWRPVDVGRERAFDVAWFCDPRDRRPTHVGVVISPGLMLHAHQDARVVCPDAYDRGPWQRLLVGFQRHAAMEARHAA